LVELYAGSPDGEAVLLRNPDSQPLWQELAAVRRERVQMAEKALQLEARIVAISRRIARLEPSHVDWLTGQTASIAEVCAALSPDTLFLLYAVLEGDLWLIPLTQDGIESPCQLGKVPSTEDVELELDWLRNVGDYPPVFVNRRADSLITAAQRPLSQWYTCFFSPITALLEQFSTLIIAPDGPLYRLPFHAFFNEQTSQYLVETHLLSYAPSLTAWLAGRKRPFANNNNLLALAYPGEKLHYTMAETAAIHRSFPNMASYIMDDAVSGQLKTVAAREAAFIHLAAHAAFRGDNALFSYIELGDGRLETLDILHLRLQAKLVVLSACETGAGILRGGEYLGLTRAFLLAGVQSVLATYWTVDDVATSRLMDMFYEQIAAGKSPVHALTLAQRFLLSSENAGERHPYYWASFFLFGASN